ncbi:MAG: hypothetical protein AAFN92_21980 [Bacteroidota bacterium]
MFRSLLSGLLLVGLPLIAFAQASDQQVIDLQGASVVNIETSYSSVSVTTGGNAAVTVNHVLTANGEDRPDLRKLEVVRENGAINIREVKPTVKLLRKEFPGDGRNIQSGKRYGGKGTFNGNLVDANLKVVVPPGVKVSVKTEYGSIIVTDVPGLVGARATYGSVDIIFTGNPKLADIDLYSNYGAVDVTLPANYSADLDLTTQYGDLLTDLDIAINEADSEEKNFYQRVVGTLGDGGSRLRCEAPYGNVYLRAGR